MDAVEEIKSRLSIEDVVSQYLELKRSGRNFKALSPFSKEKTPSLMISPEKQIWHDFSSGKGGDMFSFVMEVDGLDFKSALELLARQAGVDLEQFRSAPHQGGPQKEKIYEALEWAAKFYELCLTRSDSTQRYVYEQRGYTKSTVAAFRLGYSPNQDNALVSFLRKKGFNETQLKQAGLGTQRYKGFGDMFRDRLMVPLMDAQGRVIGFTARQLRSDNNSPKYINTPQSPVYDKSRHVFGLHLAKESIRKENFAVVVEGNLDVIASYQAGIRNVVATAGTAITAEHLKTISRFSPDIRLAFDQDQAGLTATERAIPIANKVGVSLGIITIPEGKDPDELVKKDPKLWQTVVTKPQYAVDWLIERYQQLSDITTATGKKVFSDRILAVVRDLTDQVEQDHYYIQVASLLGVSQAALRHKTSQLSQPLKKPAAKRAASVQQVDRATADQINMQNHLLSLGLILPSLRSFLTPLTRDMFLQPEAKQLLDWLKSHSDFEYSTQELPEITDYGKMLSLLFEELYQSLEVIELRYEAARLQIRLIETYVKTQKARLARAFATANEQDTDKLLEAAKRLDVLLKSAKETTK